MREITDYRLTVEAETDHATTPCCALHAACHAVRPVQRSLRAFWAITQRGTSR